MGLHLPQVTSELHYSCDNFFFFFTLAALPAGGVTPPKHHFISTPELIFSFSSDLLANYFGNTSLNTGKPVKT